MRQDWPIFCSYLDRLIQRYSSVNYQYSARRQNQMVKDSLDFFVRLFTRQIFSFTSCPFLYFVILRLIFLNM